MKAILRNLARTIRLLASRAVVALTDDAGGLQRAQVQLLADEVLDRVERFQQYGVTSVPLKGAEGIVLALGGARDHAVLIAVDDRRYRPRDLAPGESALYDDLGQMVHLTRDGIVIRGAGKPVIITDTTKLRVEADIEATGQITDQVGGSGGSMQAMRDTYNGHTHPGDSGGATGTPNQGM